MDETGVQGPLWAQLLFTRWPGKNSRRVSELFLKEGQKDAKQEEDTPRRWKM